MTRRKKKQPMKVGDLTGGKEVLPPSQLTEISTTVEHINGESIFLGVSELKQMQNGHHLPEGGVEGDRNGNTLIRAEGELVGGGAATALSSHLVKNNCKVQLSKVDVECATAGLINSNFSDMNGVIDNDRGEKPVLPGDAQINGDSILNDGDSTPNDGDSTPIDGDSTPIVDDSTPNGDDSTLKLNEGQRSEVSVPMEEEELIAGDLANGLEEEETGHELVMDVDDDERGDFEGEIEGAVTPSDENGGMDDKSYTDICKDFFKRRRPMEVPDEFICQLCRKVFENPRDLTVHIRGHNESSSHTCNICSKKLSSASSLDRHMLIHSGERPFQCPMCEMSFTTNGNMNRHMRTHDKGASKDEPGKGAKVSATSIDGAVTPGLRSKKAKRDPQLTSDNELTCPVCHKSFICRIGFETHMTFHPDMSHDCAFCSLSFRNQRGLRMHLYKVHRNDSLTERSSHAIDAPKEEASTPQKSSGIEDLCIAEFSTKQFPKIAQIWCEENELTINGDGRSSVCLQCNRAFPCLSSLNLHLNSAHGPKGRHSVKRKTKPNRAGRNGTMHADFSRNSPKDSFMSALCLQPIENDQKRLQGRSIDIKSSETPNDWLKNYVTPEVHASGLWKGFPKMSFDQMSEDTSGRTGRPQPQSFSPLKGEMAESVPQMPFADYQESMGESGKIKVGRGPLSHGQELDTDDIGMGMFAPAESAAANIEGGELGMEEVMADENGVPWEEEDGDNDKQHKHVCKFCSKTFPFRSTLKVHVRSHMGLTPYQCMLCDYSSADKSTLVRHMRTHSGERPYSCRLCSFPFTTKANCERHLKKRHGKLAKLDIDVNIQHQPVHRLPEQGQFSSPDTVCKVCGRDFKFFRDLQNHMRVHEKTPKKLYACIKCNMNFSKKNQCVRHMLRKHRHLSSSEIQQHVQELSKKQENVSNKSHNDKAAKQSLQETLSTFKKMPFSSEEHLSGLARPVPVYVNTGYQVFPSDVQEQPLDLSMPKKGVSPPLFSPDKPSTSMDHQAGGTMNIQENTQTSLGASRYKGPYLKFYSPQLDSLVCPHCLRLFKKASRLKTHIRSHTKERPFRCSVCSAAFTRSSSLDEHMIKRHCGDGDEQSEASHEMSLMQMRMLQREQLQQQVSILKSCLQPEDDHESVLDGYEQSSPAVSDATMELSSIPKMLAAATTSTSFHQYMNSQINHHMLLDQTEGANGFEDLDEEEDLLNESAERDEDGELVIAEYQENEDYEAEVGDLMKGSRSGKLESRQTCPYCQRKFPWVSSLRRHLITHTGLKPYECPHCGATFSTKSNCERHINRRHQGQKSGEVDVAEPTRADPFKCKECPDDMAFSTRRKLQKHYKEEHPSAAFPKEYTEAPDVIVNNKDLIDKIQQGYDPVLSPTITSMIPEGTKKRNQLFFRGNSPTIKQEPLDQDSINEISSIHSPSVHTNSLSPEPRQPEQEGEDDFLEEMSFEELAEPSTETGNTIPIVVKEEKEEENEYTAIEEVQEYPEEEGSSASGIRLGESFSDKGLSEEEEDDGISENGSLLSLEHSTAPTMVGDLSGAASLIIPRVSVTHKKGKKGARFSCEQCCKRFKTEQTLIRHLKVHSLEHPFKCTVCTATFTTKFNCQRHIMKLHGKSKEEVVNITGSGKVVEPRRPASQSPPAAKKLKVSPSLYGSSMVKIAPKHRRSSSSKKKRHHSSKKIKHILPKPAHHQKPQGYEYSGESLTNGKLHLSHDGGMDGQYNGSGTNLTWGYSYAESPTGVYGGSIQEDAGIGDSDIIKNLLGIEDSSTMDQLLESADSAAKILGVQG